METAARATSRLACLLAAGAVVLVGCEGTTAEEVSSGSSPSAAPDGSVATQPGEIEGRVVATPYPWDRPPESVGAFEIEIATVTSHARPSDILRVIVGSKDVPITCEESGETTTLEEVQTGEVVSVAPLGEGVDTTIPPAVGATSVTVPCQGG